MESRLKAVIRAISLVGFALLCAVALAETARADDVTIMGNDIYLTQNDQGTITFTLDNGLSNPIYTYDAQLFDFEQVFGDFSGDYTMTSQAGDCPQTVAASSSCTLASYTFTTGTIPTTSTDICQCADYQLIYIVNWINAPAGKPKLNGPTEIKSDVFEYVDAPASVSAGVSEPGDFVMLCFGLLSLAVAGGTMGRRSSLKGITVKTAM